MNRRGRPQAGLGGERVEGRRAVRELLVAGRRRVRRVEMATGLAPSALLDEIAAAARSAGVSVRTVDPARLAGAALTEAHQGVIAHADPVPEADLDDLLADPGAFLVALDGVTDPGNLGAVLRSAEAAGATGALLPRHRAARLSPAAVKAAAGAVEHLPVATVAGVPAALERAARAGLWGVGLEAGGATSIHDLELADRPLVVVLGAEGRGLSRLARRRCDVLAAIPLAGRTASLNVAAAAAVACFEVARQRSGSVAGRPE